MPTSVRAIRVAPERTTNSWLGRCFALRDRLLANPRFRQWATRFPLTRPIARRSALALFDICSGFVYSQILLACVRLRVFDILAEGPQTVATLSGRLSLCPNSTRRLLAAAASIGLVAPRGAERFGLGPLGATLVANPSIAAIVEHHALFYADLNDPVALLQGKLGDTELARYWPYAGGERPDLHLTKEQVARYSTFMSVSQPLVAEQILDAYSLDRHECLLDVGGGDGTFIAAVGARTPRLRFVLFDLPQVVRLANERLGAAGLANRVSLVGGDFLVDSLPKGADIASLVRVIHDHDDEEALAILRRVRRALPPRGTLLLAEPMRETPGAQAMGDAYFGFYLLAMGRGQPRTPAELQELLRQAGFDRMRLLRTSLPLQTGLIVARSLTRRSVNID